MSDFALRILNEAARLELEHGVRPTRVTLSVGDCDKLLRELDPRSKIEVDPRTTRPFPWNRPCRIVDLDVFRTHLLSDGEILFEIF
jgi:hypothetical protein